MQHLNGGVLWDGYDAMVSFQHYLLVFSYHKGRVCFALFASDYY